VVRDFVIVVYRHTSNFSIIGDMAENLDLCLTVASYSSKVSFRCHIAVCIILNTAAATGSKQGSRNSSMASTSSDNVSVVLGKHFLVYGMGL
jgi:hypothetical protein